MDDEIKIDELDPDDGVPQPNTKVVYHCDRCGFIMIEKNCKVQCPNCGNQFDCSDLNIYFD